MSDVLEGGGRGNRQGMYHREKVLLRSIRKQRMSDSKRVYHKASANTIVKGEWWRIQEIIS